MSGAGSGEKLALDRPIVVQYAKFLERLVIDRDLGKSYITEQSVNTIIEDAAPVTASLVFGGAILWMMIGLSVGILSALRPRSLIDRGAMVFVLIGVSAHPVWIGLIFSYFFGAKLELTPITGYCDAFNPPEGLGCGGIVDWAHHMILPWATFAILFAALYVRMVRANVMETMNEDFVRTARAKGAPERRVMRSHILRNALLPVVTMLGMDIGIALGGAIFTEAVYTLAGAGANGGGGHRPVRSAHCAGGGRLRDACHHHVQPRGRHPLRVDRPPNQAVVTAELCPSSR